MISLKVLSLALIAFAQTPAEKTPTLASPYVDGSQGFSISPPADWRLDRRRITDSHGVTLLRVFGSLPNNRVEEIEIKETSPEQRLPLDKRLKRAHHAMQLEYSDVEVESTQLQKIAGHNGALMTATLWREGSQWLRLHAFVDIEEGRYFEIIYSGPIEVRQASEPLFHQVLASFKITAGEIDHEALKTFIERGLVWKNGLKPEKLYSVVLPEQVFKIERDGKLVGCLHVYEEKHTWEKHPGIRISESGWTFEPDGRIVRLQTRMFVSEDQEHERWKSSITTLVPAKGDQPEHIEAALEDGLRSQSVLLSNQLYDLNQPTTANPVLQLPPNYLSRPLLRLFPRLIDDIEARQRYAFTTFDHQLANVICRVYSTRGRADMPTGITRGKIYLIEEREGLKAKPSKIYVDERGRVQLIEAGPLRITPGDDKSLQARFGNRIDAASKRMDELEKAYNESVGRFRR